MLYYRLHASASITLLLFFPSYSFPLQFCCVSCHSSRDSGRTVQSARSQLIVVKMAFATSRGSRSAPETCSCLLSTSKVALKKKHNKIKNIECSCADFAPALSHPTVRGIASADVWLRGLSNYLRFQMCPSVCMRQPGLTCEWMDGCKL